MASKAAPSDLDSNKSTKVPHNNKARRGVLLYHKHWGKETPKHRGSPHNCVLCKKYIIPEHKYKLYRSENYFGNFSNQESIKEGLEGSLGNR